MGMGSRSAMLSSIVLNLCHITDDHIVSLVQLHQLFVQKSALSGDLVAVRYLRAGRVAQPV